MAHSCSLSSVSASARPSLPDAGHPDGLDKIDRRADAKKSVSFCVPTVALRGRMQREVELRDVVALRGIGACCDGPQGVEHPCLRYEEPGSLRPDQPLVGAAGENSTPVSRCRRGRRREPGRRPWRTRRPSHVRGRRLAVREQLARGACDVADEDEAGPRIDQAGDPVDVPLGRHQVRLEEANDDAVTLHPVEEPDVDGHVLVRRRSPRRPSSGATR